MTAAWRLRGVLETERSMGETRHKGRVHCSDHACPLLCMGLGLQSCKVVPAAIGCCAWRMQHDEGAVLRWLLLPQVDGHMRLGMLLWV